MKETQNTTSSENKEKKKNFFIPSKLVVFREAHTADDVSGIVVQDNQYGSSQKSKLKKLVGRGKWLNAIEMDNPPQKGWGIISFGSGRYRSSYDVWYLMHPLGFTVPISSSDFNDIINNSTIQDGIIETELQFVSLKDTFCSPIVMSTRSPRYKQIHSEELEFSTTHKDLQIHDIIQLKRNSSYYLYLGSWHVMSHGLLSRMFHELDNSSTECKSTKRHLYIQLGYNNRNSIPKKVDASNVKAFLECFKLPNSNSSDSLKTVQSSTALDVSEIVFSFKDAVKNGMTDLDVYDSSPFKLDVQSLDFSMKFKIQGANYSTFYWCPYPKPFKVQDMVIGIYNSTLKDKSVQKGKEVDALNQLYSVPELVLEYSDINNNTCITRNVRRNNSWRSSADWYYWNNNLGSELSDTDLQQNLLDIRTQIPEIKYLSFLNVKNLDKIDRSMSTIQSHQNHGSAPHVVLGLDKISSIKTGTDIHIKKIAFYVNKGK